MASISRFRYNTLTNVMTKTRNEKKHLCNRRYSSAFISTSSVSCSDRNNTETYGKFQRDNICIDRSRNKCASHLMNMNTFEVCRYRSISSTAMPQYRSSSKSLMSQSLETQTTSPSPLLPTFLKSISSETIASIQTLPEVSQAMSIIDNNNKTSSKSKHKMGYQHEIEGLKRASQVFEQYNPQGEEQRAVHLLEAYLLIQSQSYSVALESLTTVLEWNLNCESQKIDIELERVKMMYYLGKFDDAVDLAKDLCEKIPETENHGYEVEKSLALNTFALCQLATVGLIDADIVKMKRKEPTIEHSIEEEARANSIHEIETDEILDMLKIASKTSKNAFKQSGSAQLGLSCAVSYCNIGIAELVAVCSKSINGNKEANSTPLSIDAAMIAWREALNVLDELEQDTAIVKDHKQTNFLHKTKAKLYCNMTWAILFTPSYEHSSEDSAKSIVLKEDALKQASEYAGFALKSAEKIDDGEDLGRVLSLVALCYAKAGSAVTSEGLLQSALDSFDLTSTRSNTNPMDVMDARSAFVSYSNLCENWEKRGSDADKYQNLALEADDCMVNAWRGKSSIYSGAIIDIEL